MKCVKDCYILTLIIAVFTVSAVAQKALSTEDQAAIDDFSRRVKEYVRMREKIEEGLPKLPKDATPEQIEAHKAVFQKAVQKARTGAKHGDVITPDAERALRFIITTAYVGDDRKRLRKTIFEAENKSVPVAVNAAYPEAVEILEMPPPLLLALPELPKQMRYRFVAGSMLLMDRENHLIVDYMTNAVPL